MRRQRGAARATLSALLLVLLTMAPVGLPAAPAAAAATGGGVKAVYAAPVRDTRGRIDIAATVDRAVELGLTTYQYLLYNRTSYRSSDDLADLPAFLTVAAARGLDVWVYLVGPSQASSTARPCSADQYPPFDGAYSAWFTAIGALAATHRNLTAMALDDLSFDTALRPGHACATFTPENLAWLHGLADAAAHRHLPLHATFYLQDVTGPRSVADAFRGTVDGAVLPYTSIGLNAGDTWVDVVTAVESCRSLTASARCLNVWLPPAGSIPRGTRAGASTSFVATSTKGRLTFAWADSYLGSARGAVLAQVLVGSRVVWQGDLASNGLHIWRTVGVALSGLRIGVRTTLTVRVLAASQLNNFGALVKVDGLAVTGARLGGDALRGSGWTTSSSGAGWRPAFRSRMPIQWMVYAGALKGTTPTPATLTAELAVWRRHAAVLDGVTIYQLPLDPSSALFAAARAGLR